MFAIFYYPFATIVTLFLLGIGIAILLVPTKWKEYSFWLAPWFAIIFIIPSLIFLNIFGISVGKSAWFIVALFLSISLFVFFKKKNKFHFVLKRDVIVLCFIGISVIFNIVSLFKYEKNLTTVSLGNNDAVNYAFSSDLITDNLIDSQPIRDVASADDMFNNIYRWGPPVIESFFLTIFRLQGYQFTYIIQVVLTALIIPLMYILFSLLYKPRLLSIFFILVLTTFNVNLLYILYHNFFGQILFWGLELLIFIFFLFYLQSSKKKKNSFSKYEIISGISLGVLLMSYGEGMLFILIPLFIYPAIKLIFYRELITSYIVFIIKVSITGLVISFTHFHFITQRLVSLIGAFSKTNPSGILGWQPFRTSVPYPNPYEILGFYSIHAFEPLPFYLAVILSLIVVVVMIYGIIKSKQRIFILSFILFYVLLFYWTAIQRHNYFEYYKVITYTLFLLLILFTIGIFEIFKKRKNTMFIVIIFFTVLEIFSAIKLNKRMNRSRISADRAMISLSRFNKEYRSNRIIYSPTLLSSEVSIWPSLWREYFIYPIKLNYNPPEVVSLYQNNISQKDLVLLPKQYYMLNLPQVVIKEVEWENEYYKLGRVCNTSECLLASTQNLSSIPFTREDFQDSLLIRGWSTKEDGHRWISSKEATMRLVAKDDPVSALRIEAVTLKEPQEMTVYVNENPIDTVSLSTEWEEYTFNIGYYQNEVINIRLEFSNFYNPSALGISADNRDLAADIRKISLE